MRMVAPRTGAPEITLGEDQLDLKPIVAAVYYRDQATTLLTRWRINDDDRERLLRGEDVYLAIRTYGKPLMPLHMQIGPQGWEQEDEESGLQIE
jgi:hypothetical protein